MATDYISRAGMMRHIEREAQKWGEDYDAMQILGDIEDFPAADVVAKKDFNDCRNELCLRCGRYRESHLGACDGCRWQAEKWR